MTGSKYPKPCLPPNDGKEIFQDCDSIIRSADVACGNLEGVLADSGRLRKSLNGKLAFSFMMPTKSVQLLVDAGFDFMGIANNHIFDFWEEGTLSTIKTLKDAGDKISESDKAPVNAEIQKLKDAIAADDQAAMKQGTDDVLQALYKVSEKLYQQAGGAQGAAGAQDAGAAGAAGSGASDEDFAGYGTEDVNGNATDDGFKNAGGDF